MKYIENPLRILARSYYWQSLFHRCKELPGTIDFFENKRDFSYIQINFLQYIEQVAGLYYDMAMGEKMLCEETINDELRANAYVVYKSKNKDKQAMVTPNNITGDRLIGIPRKKEVK